MAMWLLWLCGCVVTHSTRAVKTTNNHTTTKREKRESKDRYLGRFLLVAVGRHNAATTAT